MFRLNVCEIALSLNQKQAQANQDSVIQIVIVFDARAEVCSVCPRGIVLDFVGAWACSKGLDGQSLKCTYKDQVVTGGAQFSSLGMHDNDVLMVIPVDNVSQPQKRRRQRRTQQDAPEQVFDKPKSFSSFGRPVFSPKRYSAWLQQKNFWDIEMEFGS